jgi:hypothetical protein
MKRWLPVMVLVCALGGLVWYFTLGSSGKPQTAANPRQGESPGAPPGTPLANPRSVATVSTPASANVERSAAQAIGGATAESRLPSDKPFLLGTADSPPSMDAATVLGNMRVTLNQYRSMFNENPVGTNPEITEALNGDNPKQARFIKEESGLRINGKGELVDYWGTPFFFHQLSGTEMEIHSAGPDKVMWTADDLVTK